MHSTGKCSIFSVFLYFHENWKFAVNITERDGFPLENLLFHENWKFSVNITEWDRILLENMKIGNFQ